MSPSGGLDPLRTRTRVVLIMDFISILPPAHCWWGRIPRPLATENTLLMDLVEPFWAGIRCWRVHGFCRKFGHWDGMMDEPGLLFRRAFLLDRDGDSTNHWWFLDLLSAVSSQINKEDSWWSLTCRMAKQIKTYVVFLKSFLKSKNSVWRKQNGSLVCKAGKELL